jgi:hypothetical protein
VTPHELVAVDYLLIDAAAPRIVCSCGWSGALAEHLAPHALDVWAAHALIAGVDEFTATIDV